MPFSGLLHISTCYIDVSNESKIIKGLDSFLSLSRLGTQLQSRLLLIFEDVPPIFIFLVLIFILTSTGGRLCINFENKSWASKAFASFEIQILSRPAPVDQWPYIKPPESNHHWNLLPPNLWGNRLWFIRRQEKQTINWWCCLSTGNLYLYHNSTANLFQLLRVSQIA